MSRAKTSATEETTQLDAPTEFERAQRSRVRPWAYNPNEGDVEGIMESLKQFGWGRPIVANRHKGLEGEIIIGHHAFEAAGRLDSGGITIPYGHVPGTVPVVWVNLPAKKAHGLSLADNQRAKKGKVDRDKLGQVVGLEELDPEDWLGAGFEEREIKSLMFEPWPEASVAGGGDIGHQFSVIIECPTEEQQVAVLEWCNQQELKCRALI